MKLIKMKYKDYEFRINPSSIKLQHSKLTSSQNVLGSFYKTQAMSVKPITIIGSGILAGDDMLEQMAIIEALFNKRGADYLFLPGMNPIKAHFSEISFEMDSTKNAILYTFKFIEDSRSKKEHYNFGYTIAKKDENLFDIANRLNVKVELLVSKNDFEDLFSVKEGDIVYYA